MKSVVLVGRPNVGKSSLFNRLIGRKKALVHDEPGVTRDVRTEKVSWNEFGNQYTFELSDLAGLEFDYGREGESDQKTLKDLATKAALNALAGADLALFLVDGREIKKSGLHTYDFELATLLKKHKKEVILVIAKAEGSIFDDVFAEVTQLGFEKILSCSAEHNLQIQTLKESILPFLDIEEPKSDQQTQKAICIGVYGRPNVGKSTLVNQILGETRMITSPIPGTTVDTVDSVFVRDDKVYKILDTAGIRRKAKVSEGVEKLSVVQALNAIDQVHVALFLFDGFEGLTDQDEKIAGELLKSGRPIIVVVNKWDLCRVSKEKYAERLRGELGFLDFAPVLFISARKGEGLDGIWDLVDEVLKQRHVVAPTGELNRFLEVIEGANNPTGVRLYYASQVSKNPPTIAIKINDLRKMHFAYERYLANELRKRYGWMGSPLKLLFRPKKSTTKST
ncbi:MAG: ribosome biogenesis GTPase Der [Bacteriovoracia bacterium]